MNKENCALKLVDEIIIYYDARSRKHQIKVVYVSCVYVYIFCTSWSGRLEIIRYLLDWGVGV